MQQAEGRSDRFVADSRCVDCGTLWLCHAEYTVVNRTDAYEVREYPGGKRGAGGSCGCCHLGNFGAGYCFVCKRCRRHV